MILLRASKNMCRAISIDFGYPSEDIGRIDGKELEDVKRLLEICRLQGA